MTKTRTPEIPVHIVVVLDRSGSMGPLAGDVIGGFNTFLAEQQGQPGKCRMTLVEFDDIEPFLVLADATPIADVKPLTFDSYVPRGSTPLLDAEGRALRQAETREKARQANGKKAEAVLFVTYTDGMENASREWTHAALSTAKKAAEERGWTFLYLGVGHDAYLQGGTIGTLHTNTSSAPATAQGVSASYAAASNVTTGVRAMALAGDSDSLLRASKDAYAATGTAKADDEDEKLATP